MRSLLSRFRFLALSLSIAFAIGALHWWTDTHRVASGSTGLGSLLTRSVHVAEGRVTDMHFRFRGPIAPHPDVVIVAVDEKSAAKYGLWPWSRAYVAKALRNLHRAGAAAIGMDMIFTDEDRSTSSLYGETLQHLDESIRSASASTAPELVALRERIAALANSSPDIELASAFADMPEVVQGIVTYPPDHLEQFRDRESEQATLLEPHLLRRLPAENGASFFEAPLDQLRLWRQHSAQVSLPRFAEKAGHLGHFNAEPDPDGILRRLALLAMLDGPKGFIPNLDLATAAVYFRAKLEPAYQPEEGLVVGARLRREDGTFRFVPFNWYEPFAPINHLGRLETFKRISMSDVLDGTFDPQDVKGKAVLMGVTLIGLYDQRATPFSENEAGIVSHASMLSNILSGDYLERPWEARLLEVAFILLSALGLALLIPRLRFTLKLALMVALAGAWLVASHVSFVRGIQLATFLPMMSVLIGSFATIFLGYLSVDREKGVLRTAFQHYLNKSVMEQMLAHPDRLKLGGEKKEMTVLFSDIRGFTTLSERMAPEALVKFINSYLTPMTRIVFDEGGTLDKYIGDALMAFWGAPIEQPDHALRACRAAVRFLGKLQELKVAWRDQNLPEFDIGVGINSGQMIVGNMGSDVRFDYTVMGDSVNLATRLEGTNKEYETRVLISEATYLMARDEIVARRLGAVRVKGKRKPVRIYELRGLGKAEGLEARGISLFEEALEHYTAQRFGEAEAGFHKVLEVWPDDAPSRRYIDEIAIFKVRPPGSAWDGVYTATTK